MPAEPSAINGICHEKAVARNNPKGTPNTDAAANADITIPMAAARRLATKYGSQAVVGIMRLLHQSSDNQYAPVVNSVSQLEEKWPSVLNFVRKQKSSIIDI